MENYLFEEYYLKLRIKELKKKIYRWLTKDSSQFFLKGNDLISIDCQLFGVHEPVITKLISFLSEKGFNNFLFDIGANIGINSCQNGDDFDEVHMFEPNPLAQKIAEVNAAVSLSEGKWNLYPYGLGGSSYSAMLRIPKKNWGGAYIVGGENSYDEKILLGKENFNNFRHSDYLYCEVKIKDTQTILKELFKELVFRKKFYGVIKIDVEGMEPTIITGIAKAIPIEIKSAIIFESFNPKLNFSGLIQLFNGRAKGYIIQQRAPFQRSDSLFTKLTKFMGKQRYSYRLAPFSNVKELNRDLVLIIN